MFCNRICTLTLALLVVCFGNIAFGEEVTNAESDQKSAKQKRPNILFILTDDQAPFSIGAYGNQESNTPNINRLAKMGMRFDAAYNMGAFLGAVCTPSRHMIMSGRTVWHIPKATTRQRVLQPQKQPAQKSSADKKNKNRQGKNKNKRSRQKNQDASNPNIPKNLELNTIGAVFNRAGYSTMRTCKRGNSYPAPNKQFTVVKDASKRQAGTEDGSAWHADQVIDFLDQRSGAEDEKPFMVYFGFSHPHDPRYANDQLLAKYGASNKPGDDLTVNSKMPALPINYLPKHPFHDGHPGLRDETKVQGVMTSRCELTIRNEKGREYACIENVDNQIGRVLKKLEESGELENTYIVFTSDHGIAIGRHGLMGKQNLYEHSWRVPYIVAGPGIKPNTHATGNIYLLDTLATLCDFAGIKSPETNEGISIRPVLEGKKDTVRDVLYGCYCGGTKPGMRSVRKGDWKLIKYETLDGKVKETQLFNLKENPHELIQEHHAPAVIKMTGNKPKSNQVDLAEDPKYANKLKEMEALLLSEMQRLDDPYRFDE